MKVANKQIGWLIQVGTLALVVGCGATNRASTSTSSGTASETATTVTTTYTETSTSTSTSTGSEPPYRYEFTLNGSQTAITPQITTDNVLKVRFQVTGNQGNSVHSATELAVTIAVNGTEVIPQYTSNYYTYGQVGETSELIDLSSYITPGVPVQIVVKNPKNDFYCTYWGGYNYDGSWVNPQYNSYPGCRKAVNSAHNWSGIITVQTSATTAI